MFLTRESSTPLCPTTFLLWGGHTIGLLHDILELILFTSGT